MLTQTFRVAALILKMVSSIGMLTVRGSRRIVLVFNLSRCNKMQTSVMCYKHQLTDNKCVYFGW